MCPICWISGFIDVIFGGSFIATVNHPISWILGLGLITYSFYKFYEAKKRGKKMTNETKKRNKRIIFRFVIVYSLTHKEHERMHQLLKKHGIEEHSH